MIENQMRPLNLNDLADALHLDDTTRQSLAAPIIDELRTLSAPTAHYDQAGIPLRGRSAFEPYLDGHTIRELGAAYVELRALGAQPPLIDELEVARGIPT